MRFAIMESVVTPGGHEIDFDRLLVEELTALGNSVEFYVPEGHEFKWNYGVPGVIRRHLFHMCNLDDHHLIYNLNLLLK